MSFPKTTKVSQTFAKPKRLYHRLTTEDIAKAEELLEKGLSYGEAARKLGCTDGALRNRFPGYNRPKDQW